MIRHNWNKYDHHHQIIILMIMAVILRILLIIPFLNPNVNATSRGWQSTNQSWKSKNTSHHLLWESLKKDHFWVLCQNSDFWTCLWNKLLLRMDSGCVHTTFWDKVQKKECFCWQNTGYHKQHYYYLHLRLSHHQHHTVHHEQTSWFCSL